MLILDTIFRSLFLSSRGAEIRGIMKAIVNVNMNNDSREPERENSRFKDAIY